MINRSVFCMFLCLLSSQLISMQKKMLSVEDLNAFTIVLKLEDYEKRMEKYTLEPSVVTDIIKILLETEDVSDDFNKRIATMYEARPDTYTQLITSIMLQYYAKRNETPNEIDIVKAEIDQYLA